MITEEQVAQIRHLFHAEHWKIGTIVAELHLHPDTVRAALDTERFRSHARLRNRLTNPYLDFLRQTLQQYPRLRATRLFQMIRLRGYPGSVNQLRRVVAELRPPQREAFLRLRTFPGEQGQADWAHFGEVAMGRARRRLSAFVLILSYSRALWLEFFLDQTLENFLLGHVHAFQDWGGAPRNVATDNLRSVVLERRGDAIHFHPRFLELSAHYHFATRPCRPARGNEKAKVETGVQIVQRWIVAALRHRKFFSLAELNQAIRELLDKLNQRPFRKRSGCRASLFQELDRPALGPLPQDRFELQQWATARVNIDYHVEIDRHYYSVPYVLTGQVVEIRSTLTTIEIFHRGERAASHVRSHLLYKATTVNEHRPKSHQQHLAWPPSRLLHWAQSVGAHTAQLFKVILESKPHPEMGYRSCLGILRLGQRYSSERVEAAATRALATGACSYQSVKSMLERGLDRQPLETPAPRPPLEHDNLRGAAYFDPSDTPRLL